MEIKRAIILAGGLGERLRPLTENTPKPLLPIKGKPTLQHTIENFAKQGVIEIILGISYHADKIKEYFKDGSELGINLRYSVEEVPLGTGGAVKKAAEGIDGSFFLSWGDNLTDIDLSEMEKIHKRNQAKLTIALTEREDVENFGVAEIEEDKIIRFVEKPKKEEAPSRWINAGVFIIEPEILDMLPGGKSSIEKDCFEKIVEKGEVFCYKHKGQWYPTDTLDKYNQAEKDFQPRGE